MLRLPEWLPPFHRPASERAEGGTGLAPRRYALVRTGSSGGVPITLFSSVADRPRSRGGPAAHIRRLAPLLAALLGLACDPYSDLRAGLDPASLERFARGQQAATPCWSCHDVTGTSSRIGPGLKGMFGSRAGSSPSQPHSDAMRRSGITWTPSTVDAFLANGPGLIPGNDMIFPGIADPRTRADLVFFLELATRADRQ